MQFDVGDILEGKITGLTSYGAFVELPDNKTGMVHISEVSTSYVKDIHECLQEGQQVKVKVLSIDGNGKISLSIKRTVEAPKRPQQRARSYTPSVPARTQSSEPSTYEWQPKKTENMSFEDMMSRFKQASDEKMTVLKKNGDNRRASVSRRNGGK